MTEKRDWSRNRAMWERVLEKRTGEGVSVWVKRIQRARIADEAALRAWLNERGITGYAQSLLVMERFGYPDFLRADADELIDAQYADRLALRAVYDAIMRVAVCVGDVQVQARKTYVSLLTPRRTFARVQPTTRTRVDVGLRIEGVQPHGRLQPSTIHETMQLRIALSSPKDVNADFVKWLTRAYRENS